PASRRRPERASALLAGTVHYGEPTCASHNSCRPSEPRSSIDLPRQRVAYSTNGQSRLRLVAPSLRDVRRSDRAIGRGHRCALARGVPGCKRMQHRLEGPPVTSGRQRYSIISDGLPTQLPDIDPEETKEWLESFDTVVRTRG